MPVVINYNKCTCGTSCFAALVCPNQAMVVSLDRGGPVVDPQLCLDCPGKCLNFCDQNALKFAPNLKELAIITGEMNGTLTAEEVLQARQALSEEKEVVEPIVVVLEVTAKNFEAEVIHSDLPVVVDFWADWCQPCKQIAPIVESLAEKYAGRVKFAKVDTEAEKELAQVLRIQSLPTLMFFYQGQLIDGVVGAVSAPQLEARVVKVLTQVDAFEATKSGKPVAVTSNGPVVSKALSPKSGLFSGKMPGNKTGRILPKTKPPIG